MKGGRANFNCATSHKASALDARLPTHPVKTCAATLAASANLDPSHSCRLLAWYGAIGLLSASQLNLVNVEHLKNGCPASKMRFLPRSIKILNLHNSTILQRRHDAIYLCYLANHHPCSRAGGPCSHSNAWSFGSTRHHRYDIHPDRILGLCYDIHFQR